MLFSLKYLLILEHDFGSEEDDGIITRMSLIHFGEALLLVGVFLPLCYWVEWFDCAEMMGAIS